MTTDEFYEIVCNGTNNDSRVKSADFETDGALYVELDDGSEWRIKVEAI